MTNSQLIKYFWLLDNLIRVGEHGLTLDEINRLWSRSTHNDSHSDFAPRTFYRYVNELRTIFGVDIRRSSGRYRIRSIYTSDFDITNSIVKTIIRNATDSPSPGRPGYAA